MSFIARCPFGLSLVAFLPLAGRVARERLTDNYSDLCRCRFSPLSILAVRLAPAPL